MPLTPDEIQFRRLNDPYFGLAEELSGPSLALTKGASLAAATVEKNRRLDPAAAAADEAFDVDQHLEGRPSKANLLDVAESSFFRSRENIFDLISGFKGHPGVDRAQEIQEFADFSAGLTAEDRQRLVSDRQQKVIDSLAIGGLQGNLDAAGHAILAGPATLADSAAILGEIGLGAVITATGVGAAGSIPLFANRARKVVKGGKKLLTAIDKAKGAIGTAARSASQVSIAVADITQGNVVEFRKLHGVDPTRGEAASMFAVNLATLMVQPSIISNLFVPKFKKEIVKEIKSLGKNIVGGSNIKSIANRVVDGTRKVVSAAGAEAGQEYFQTWGEALNVSMGPEQRKTFFESVFAILTDEEKQLDAKTGAFLGFGAGGTARAAIAAPGLAVGTAIDTTKGTVKTAVKATGAVVKAAGRVAKKVADKAAFQVLSKEEVETIRSERISRKTVVDAKVADLQASVDIIEKATTIEDLRKDEEVSKRASKIIQDSELTDADLTDKKLFKQLKRDLVRPFKGDIGLLKVELETDTGVAVLKQSAKNIERKAVDAAVATVKAVAPGVKAVVESVKQFGEKTVKAVEEIRSSTALGMIEIAANAGKAEIKTILEAAKSLDKNDLDRVTAVIGQLNPDLGRQLKRAVAAKDKALKRTGLKRGEIITEETLNPIITDVAKRGSIDPGEVASVSSALNETVASNIEDLASVGKAEAALAAVEASEDFKKQQNGAMSRDNAVIVKRKLNRARARLESRPRKVVEEVVKTVKETAEKVVDAVSPVVDTVVEKVKGAVETVKEAAAEVDTVKINSTFRAVTEAVVTTLKDPKLASALADSAGDFLKQMKRFGVNTRAQFESYVKQFPELETNVEFFKQLDEAYPTDISANEVFDIVKTKAVATLQKIKDAYNELNPNPECKV